jgi:hypothetical protein
MPIDLHSKKIVSRRSKLVRIATVLHGACFTSPARGHKGFRYYLLAKPFTYCRGLNNRMRGIANRHG